MFLVFLPDIERLFLWGEESPPRGLEALSQSGTPYRARLVTPDGRLALADPIPAATPPEPSASAPLKPKPTRARRPKPASRR